MVVLYNKGLHYITDMDKIDLNEWEICNPDNRQDRLPQPYRLISEVLNETILHQLSLSMFEIQEKKKDKNYEGTIKQYLSQNVIDVQNITCFTSNCNQHNHLLAGDKSGSIYLLDLAKKIVFSKKQIFTGRRVQFIAESIITDGDVSFTTVAAVLNSHHKVYILRYKHGEPKLALTHEITVTANSDNPNKLPYYCQFDDYSRLLFVFTYEGSIIVYRIPQIPIDLNIINRQQTIPLEEQQFKKKLKYPLNYANIQTQVAKISEPVLQIKFPGKQKPIPYNQLNNKLSKKAQVPVEVIDPKKDQKKGDKKQEKKQAPPSDQVNNQELQFNSSIPVREIVLENGHDNSLNYPLPKYRPFAWIVHSRVELQKKKQFEKGRYVDIAQKIIYGWTNLKQFNISSFLPSKTNYYCNFLYIQHYLQRIPQSFEKQKLVMLGQKISLKKAKVLKNIYQITATALSQPDQHYFATGMANGVTSIWSTNSLNVLMNTDKQIGSITQLAFFEKWKIISGTSKGQIQIDNLLTQKSQVKRTNIFQSRVDYPIVSIKISQLGVAFALDSNANLRVYDLWRNQKIARVNSCNSFSLLQNKGKRWLSSTSVPPNVSLYTNHDFTVVISTNWPHFTSNQLADSPQKRIQIDSLITNPWKCKGTNVHVVRNFEFLLNLFDGLQTIYKKGYDRKKVQNLFTNLQFVQLYDRSFDIPDFGVTNASKKTQKYTQVGFGAGSKSQMSSKSKSRQKNMKESSSGSHVKYRLTNEVLHPQKFLLQRRKIIGKEVITEEVLKGKIRDCYRKQGALENSLQNDLSKGLL